MDDLAASLRAWRDRLTPGEAGLKAHHGRRRAPGLRRQEVAELAGLSVGYLTRLEQGRATHPSPLVVEALARALRLSADEEQTLFQLAGQVPHAAQRMNRHITPGVQRMLDRLDDLPVLVNDAAWELVATNALGAALIGDPSAKHGRERNMAWCQFTGVPSRVKHTPEQHAAVEAEIVADLHVAAARWPDDERLQSLIADLKQTSPRFATLWETRPALVRTSARKTFEHPEVGRLTLDCDSLFVHGSDLRIVVFSAAPGTPDADALALVGVVGLQIF
jgi:transcriptional regulator with XRE-family HTH domain